MSPARGLPRHLVAQRRWQAARKAQELRCPCGTVVWFGLDDDECAMTAMVEQPIVDLADAQALLEQGRVIFYRDRVGQLWRLHDGGITGSFVRNGLLVEHVCQESAA
jgi:hypothetical protein